MNWDTTLKDIEDWILSKVKAAGARGLVIGLSGGIDSAVVSVICKRVFPENVLGIIMPCYSNDADITDAEIGADKFSINTKIIILDKVFDELIIAIKDSYEEDDLAVANIKPRLRMTTLYYYAQKNNYLVAGTGNKSEILTGYFTKYGDGGVDIEPIGHLYKTEIYELAEYLKIPQKIITKTPSAGLWEGQSDEEELGISYYELDKYLKTGNAEANVKKTIDNLITKNEHKRFSPPIPKL